MAVGMFEKVAKNQHYVWRHYLEAWAPGGKVACYRQSDGTAFSTNPKNIGAERYFYRLDEFTEDELAYLDRVAKQSRTELGRTVNRNFLQIFTVTTRLRRLVTRQTDPAKRAESERLLLNAERGLGESWQVAIENKGAPFLTRLRARDAAFWLDEDAACDFCIFLGTQYMRTARMRNEVRAAVLPSGLDLKRVWQVECYFWATEIGLAMYRQRGRTAVEILENDSLIPFITGDQPIINIKPQRDPLPAFYYPIDARTALLLSVQESGNPYTHRKTTAMEAEQLNHRIFGWSDDQIYGLDEPYLEALAQLPKNIG